jgi:predicted XRE-type DNA-binding protein
MQLDEAIKHYKTQRRLAEVLRVGEPCISNWRSRGKIPAMAQLKIQKLSRGKLKADVNVFGEQK